MLPIARQFLPNPLRTRTNQRIRREFHRLLTKRALPLPATGRARLRPSARRDHVNSRCERLMAEEAVEAAALPPVTKKKMSGKKLVLFIILPLLLFGGGGAAAWFLLFQGHEPAE